MSWKDYFYFTKQEKRGLSVLIVMLIVLIGTYVGLPYFISNPVVMDDEEVKLQIADFEKTLQEDSASFVYKKQHWSKNIDSTTSILQVFDPNHADSALFLKLGIKPYVISRILKYRAKGGVFRSPTDFSKIYGLPKEMYERLLPYIQIKPIARDKQLVDSKESLPVTTSEITFVDINKADTTMLKTVKGIGSVLSKRIVTYREKLGGFISVEQLKEVYGITDEVYQKIAPQLTVSQSYTKKISINQVTVHQLKQHPYISFYQAQSIYEYRMGKRTKRIENIEEIPFNRDINSDFIEKIKPYVTCE